MASNEACNHDDRGWGLGILGLFGLAYSGAPCCSLRNKVCDEDEAQQASRVGRPPSLSDLVMFQTLQSERSQPSACALRAAALPEAAKAASGSRAGSTMQPNSLRTPTVGSQRSAVGSQRSDEAASPEAVSPDAPTRNLQMACSAARPDVPVQLPVTAGLRPCQEVLGRRLSPTISRRGLPGRPKVRSHDNTPSSCRVRPHWQWPNWCLNVADPCIEVFVEDEEWGESMWVKARPKNRVVDKNGDDAFLCVEYEWEGAYYSQDFGPQHVRGCAGRMSVLQLHEHSNALAEEARCAMATKPSRTLSS
eukprot:NODE_7336_length_1588_cov_19.342231.p1 GENE.NODE_7336_length_1588_cov_19.342231~~NODE_7336_length_1588_cov_19.342231.p1  ORF type:complete len:306 (+),score=40.42 NODE_7336_length_1588_cov_19.342231:144-1061(+)